jgi:hypothetical protein
MRGESAAWVNQEALKSLLSPPLRFRLERPHEPSTFDPSRSGHVIKLVVGLIQEYGALLVDEIVDILGILNVVKVGSDVNRYLLCAEAAGWVKEVPKGSSDYFVAVTTRTNAATLYVKESAKIKSRTRRRLLIRDHWQEHDGQRYKAITQIAGGGAIE